MTERYKNWLILGLVAILSTIVVWLGTGVSSAFKNFDGPLYVAVAQTWYDKEAIGGKFSFPLPLEYYPAHLPLYPALIWGASVGLQNPFWAMLFVTLIGSVAGAILFYEIAKSKKWDNPLFLSLLWLFVWPRMWAVRSVGSPETWFIAFIMTSLWMFEKKKYWLSGILGALAIWTKSPAVLLIPTYLLIASINKIKGFKAYIPIGIMVLAGVGLFGFFRLRTGDFFAYFHTGDNIHLGLPFGIFDSNKTWVGNAWLEDILWIYLIAMIGIVRAWQKDRLWAIWGGLFLSVIIFVSHRDIARYSLPLVPVVILGFSDLMKPRWVKIILLLMLIPLYFYTVNFVKFNVMPIQNWGEFLSSSR